MARPKRYFQMPDVYEPNNVTHTSDEFDVPAKNEAGQSDRIWLHLPPELLGWLDSHVKSGQFPFVRVGDAARYCILLGCTQMSLLEPQLPDYRDVIEAAARMVRQKEMCASVMGHLDEVKKFVDQLHMNKAWSEIVDLLEQERANAKRMAKCSPYWSTRWEEELQKRFFDIGELASLRCMQRSVKEESVAEDPSVRFVDLRPSRAYHTETEGD
jgi:hypothetical protein